MASTTRTVMSMGLLWVEGTPPSERSGLVELLRFGVRCLGNGPSEVGDITLQLADDLAQRNYVRLRKVDRDAVGDLRPGACIDKLLSFFAVQRNGSHHVPRF